MISALSGPNPLITGSSDWVSWPFATTEQVVSAELGDSSRFGRINLDLGVGPPMQKGGIGVCSTGSDSTWGAILVVGGG